MVICLTITVFRLGAKFPFFTDLCISETHYKLCVDFLFCRFLTEQQRIWPGLSVLPLPMNFFVCSCPRNVDILYMSEKSLV